jgi:hypothetical protein
MYVLSINRHTVHCRVVAMLRDISLDHLSVYLLQDHWHEQTRNESKVNMHIRVGSFRITYDHF